MNIYRIFICTALLFFSFVAYSEEKVNCPMAPSEEELETFCVSGRIERGVHLRLGNYTCKRGKKESVLVYGPGELCKIVFTSQPDGKETITEKSVLKRRMNL